MHPVLLRLGGFTVSTFGILMVAGFFVGWVILAREFARKGLAPQDAQTAVLIAAFGGVLGSKLYYLLDHWDELARDPFGMLTSRGGLTWYGGFVLATLLLVLFARARRIPVLVALDCLAPALALGYSVGRIGCYLVGDDYGRAATVPWAVAFPEGAPPITVAVHPTQVYETLASAAIFAFLWTRRRRPAPDGALVFQWFILAGVERFLVEFLRTNEPVLLGLTEAQLLSLGMVVVGAAGLAVVHARWERRPARSASGA
jgi:phosphatidylglycerol:prolipoprotein diacylglycerol transferase